MTTEERILQRSSELFAQFGINVVRTDDISTDLGISKKTFYKYFVSKEELVVRVMQEMLERSSSEMDQLVNSSGNAIEQTCALWDLFTSFQKKYNPNFIRDMQRSYARAWELVEQFRSGLVKDVLIRTLKTGIGQNFYREDLNKEIIARLWLDLSSQERPIPGSEDEIKNLFIRGLLTSEGFRSYSFLCSQTS
ncbi:MAG TPA: TetR/AcrR family transcriptional regulator [Dyadobacter sp.]|jgi:AcrR family transcriptional regulator|nr:TetR/AcrR family transcriptional regulator [Dyadobacter sp.]